MLGDAKLRMDRAPTADLKTAPLQMRVSGFGAQELTL